MLFVSERRWLYNSASCFRCISVTSLFLLQHSFGGLCMLTVEIAVLVGLSWTKTEPGGEQLVLRTLDHRLIANILQFVLLAFHIKRISLNALSELSKAINWEAKRRTPEAGIDPSRTFQCKGTQLDRAHCWWYSSPQTHTGLTHTDYSPKRWNCGCFNLQW